ncbi:hypothetical protein ACQP2E_10810 [Actinoplanes sp. CA-015351]|uniref:hypothetical protein n=1 Tax=Actinoplanes sp. CA-015351 TaxID=3239897 RepID=UPI003D98E391
MRRRLHFGWMLPASIVAVLLGVVSGITWLVSRLIDVDQFDQGEISDGRPCIATVQSISDTHKADVYRVELRLHAYDGTEEVDTVVRESLTPAEAGLAIPGAEFRCVTDPEDHTHVEVFWSE